MSQQHSTEALWPKESARQLRAVCVVPQSSHRHPQRDTRSTVWPQAATAATLVLEKLQKRKTVPVHQTPRFLSSHGTKRARPGGSDAQTGEN